MSYPNYPNNRLVVGGVDLTTTYDLILVDGYKLSPPEPKTYVVDIPGGNGKLDLTESLLGDTAYENRKQEFTFYVINAQNFEQTKTQVSNYLHGKAFDYTMTMDPDYTYHGRFSVSSYEHGPSSMGKIGMIKISIDSDPFKMKPVQERVLNAIAGQVYRFESGRKRVQPTIISDNFITVEYGGHYARLPIGSWTLTDLFFDYNSDNEVYFNSYSVRSTTWYYFKYTSPTTWGDLKEHKLYEWYKINGIGNVAYDIWADVSSVTWGNLTSSGWGDLYHLVDPPYTIHDIKVRYDWGDL